MSVHWGGRGPGHVSRLPKAAGSFTPDALFASGEQGAWYAADDPVYSDDAGATPSTEAGKVAVFKDKSGGGFHLAQTVDANRPILKTVASSRCIRFSGTQFFNIPAGLTLDKQNSSVFVCHKTRNRSSIQALWHMPTASTAFALYLQDGVSMAEMRVYNGGVQNTSIDGSTVAQTAAMVASASGIKTFLGKETATVAAAAAGTVSGGYVGQWSGAAFLFMGDIHEIVVIKRAVTDAEAAQILAYLEAKWGAFATTSNVLLVTDGDSITAGVGSTGIIETSPYVEDQSYPIQLSRLFAKASRPKLVNNGAGGDTIQNMAATVTGITTNLLLKNAAFGTRVVLLLVGTNDITSAARTAAQVQGDLQTYINAVHSADPSAKVVGLTILPRTGNSAPQNATLASVNAWILANTGGYDQVFDLANVAGLTDASNTTYYSDGTHPTDAGYALIAAALKAKLTEWGYA